MKKIFFAIALGALLFACKSNKEEQTPTTETHPAEVAYAVFGDEITQDGAITKEEMTQIYARLQPGDTITTKFKTTINEVCQDRKSTRLNSSHVRISYAVFCLK